MLFSALFSFLSLAQAGSAGPEPAEFGTRPYIVVMSDAAVSIKGYDGGAAAAHAAEQVTDLFAGSVVRHVYNSSLFGFSASLTPMALEHVKDDPNVFAVEEDGVVSTSQNLWNLDRINQRNLPLDNTMAKGTHGKGTVVYVVDTGVRSDHDDFVLPSGQTRVVAGKSFVRDGRGWEDCNGHGTHCASTAAGNKYGVASGATVISVRVLGCSGTGTYSDMIAGLDWIMRDSAKRAPDRSVVSMSLGGGRSEAMNRAVDNAVAAGISVAVAAGNENDDACKYSPSSANKAVSVAASNSRDQKSSFSNYGRCVDIVAPGSSIPAADYRGRSGFKVLSGTSMACPHVAGAIAAVMATGKPSIDAAAYVLQTATPSTIQGLSAPMLYAPLDRQSPPAKPVPRPAPVPSPSLCRTERNVACQFPFTFRDQTYFSCTTTQDTKAWCSTKVDGRGKHVQGNWGYCRAQKGCFACDDKTPARKSVATAVVGCSGGGGCKQNLPSRIALSTLILVSVQTIACFAVVYFEIRTFKNSLPDGTPRGSPFCTSSV